MESSTCYFHLKADVLADIQICISVPLNLVILQYDFLRGILNISCVLTLYKNIRIRLPEPGHATVKNFDQFSKFKSFLKLICPTKMLHKSIVDSSTP